MTPRTTDQSTVDFLTQLEGCKYQMYLDTANKPSIGIGHLILPNEPQYLTCTLSPDEVAQLLHNDILPESNAVNKGVTVDINQNQFNALVSFAFNEGITAFLTSTLLKVINSGGSQDDVTAQFLRWDKEIENGQLVENQGLLNRRNKEIALYFTPDNEGAAA